jgi:tRNA1Val (adenine37-N6)-methyltransferase
MGRNNYFKFKQFTIHQEKTAMKVGTDGVLIGAWTNVESCKKILDVGTGTGLIALMLAQRSEAKITAIEIEKNAVEEAILNVSASQWEKRIEVQHISLQKFVQACPDTFDLIVSNPPFFKKSFKAPNEQRTLARHNDSLSFSDLISCSAKILSSNGKLALILPIEAACEIENLAEKNDLFLVRKSKIKARPAKEANRVLMEFGKNEAVMEENCFTVYTERLNEYSESFIELIKDFYLNY